jgi:hypothetical protein
VRHDRESSMKNGSTQLTFGLTGIEQRVGDFETATEVVLKVRAPASFKASDMKRMSRDCDLLKQRLDENPNEMGELLSLVIAGRLQDARPLAKRLKLREEDFAAQGGGLLWLAVAVGAAVLLWPKEAR